MHVKPKNETEKYYNICDVYETPSTLILAVSMNNFKKALAKYTKKGGKLSLLSLFWKKEIAKIKLKSKNSKN